MTVTARSVAGEPWFVQPALARVFAALNCEGGEARVVGGAVRNAMMGLPVADVDLATTWIPERTQALAEAAGFRVVPTGIDHGTVTLVTDGATFEVTTLRKDIMTDGRHAVVAFGTDWLEDAMRRDLTINALYADAKGHVHDPVGGLADVESRTVRFIGDAATRIAEDHLRILRFFRFFARFGTGRPDAEALRACVRGRDWLASLSPERVWKELKALLSAPDPGRALLWMRQTGILALVLPETEKWGIDAIPGLVRAERMLGWPADAMARLMAVVPPDPLRIEALAARLRMSRAESGRLAGWADAPAVAADLAGTSLDRLLYRHGAAAVTDRVRLALAIALGHGEDGAAETMAISASLTALLARASAWVRPVFPLGGKDLIAAGIAPGPDVGVRLAAAETRWVDGNFTLDRDALLALALAPDPVQ